MMELSTELKILRKQIDVMYVPHDLVKLKVLCKEWELLKFSMRRFEEINTHNSWVKTKYPRRR